MEKTLTPKNADFICINCDFKCYKNSDWLRHINTKKHNYGLNGNKKYNLENIKNANSKCECGKIYSSFSGLWKHKKICIVINEKNKLLSNNKEIISSNQATNNEQNDREPSDKELILMLIKENSELKNMMMKVIENGTNNTNIIHTNSHNKAFNLNFFLNETCKDAMNITDFVDSIKLQLSDLEKVGELGYVEGISNIIIKNLNDLDETKRPVHCTDKKRETIYIKDQGQWEKEDDNKSKLKKAVNKIAHKNIKLISQFREKYPECKKCDSHLSDKYNKMIIEAMGGSGDNNKEKEEKIIRNITKATTISQK
jgi:hypothetical protein